MFDGLLRAAGVTPAAIASGRARAEQIACALEDLARVLASEYGQPIRDGSAPAHSPARLPHLQLVELPAAGVLSVDLEAALGKPATRGHVANIGDAEVGLRFVGLRGEEPSGRYYLPAGGVLDFSSWVVRRLEVAADPAEAARAQVLAQ